jgi:beta-apo-4'-carotenal oxygenase
MVAKIIAKKAAETLTPQTLELGGRNLAIVTKHADPKLAARRLLWAKTLNAGHVCLSQNCTFVDREILPAFIHEMRLQLQEFYPDGAKNSLDYGRIVNARQFQRMKKMLDASSGEIVIGDKMDESDLFIEPTVVQVSDANDSLLTSESFGPLLPILPVDSLDEAIRIANELHNTPLGLTPSAQKPKWNTSSPSPARAAPPSQTASSTPAYPPCPLAAWEPRARAPTAEKPASTRLRIGEA